MFGLKFDALMSLKTYAIILLPAAALYALGLFGVLSSNAMRYLLQICLYITLGEAWNLLSGFAGMTSLGQQLFIGLAGYTMAVVTSTYNLSLLWGIVIAMATSLVVAIPLSQVLFRMRGMYFAIATWVAAEAMEKIFLNWRFVGQGSGMSIRLSPYPTIDQLFPLALLLCCGSLVIVCAVLHSKLGLGLMAMRDDPETAAAVGVNPARSSLAVYLIAAILTALAGALFFVNKGTIYPDSGYSVGWTVAAVFICIIGGSGTVLGPVAGAIIFVLLQEFLAHYPGWSNIMLGLFTLLVIFYLPNGIVGSIRRRFGVDLLFARRR